jgi:short-subunit dehydrogenase
VLVARDAADLALVAEEASRLAPGAQTLVIQADVGNPGEVERIATTALQRFGVIDVWINNAGVGAIGRFEDIPVADQLRVLQVNLDGVIAGSYYALRQFRQQGRGTLINIGSVEGRVPVPYQAAYVASKHAVVGLGSALNQELRLDPSAKSIHVVTVNPFAADTPFFEHTANYSGRMPRSVLLDPPEKVVNAIVAAAVWPQPEIAVGYKAKASQASQRVSRTVTETMIAGILHDKQMNEAPPADNTPGILYEPDGAPGRVDGSTIERIAQTKREARQRKDAHEDARQ